MIARIIAKDESVFTASVDHYYLDHTSHKMDSVAIPFEKPVWVTYDRKTTDGYWSRGEEFYLAKHNNAIMVWGQGNEYSRDTLRLHPDDAAAILAGKTR